MAARDSGLRSCDLRRVRPASISGDGHRILVRRKTGKTIRVIFRQETIAAINESFPPARELIGPLWGRLEQWRREAKRLVKAACLRGSIGQFRHSSGTAVELEHPGRGHEPPGQHPLAVQAALPGPHPGGRKRGAARAVGLAAEVTDRLPTDGVWGPR